MAENVDKTVAYLQALHDAALDALKSSTQHIATLRRENAELRAQIAAGPSVLTELQDRVTLLETMLHPTHYERRLAEIRGSLSSQNSQTEKP